MSDTTDVGKIGLLVAIGVGLLVLVPLFAMGSGMMGYGHMGGGLWGAGPGGGMFIAGILVQVVFLAVIAGGVYLVYRTATGAAGGTDPALEELRQAYARGDISEEEYDRRRERLERE